MCIFFYLFACTSITSLELAQERLNKAILIYDEGNFQEASNILEEIIEDTIITRDEEISARTYLAFSYVARGKRMEAKKQFIKILKLNEDFSLNPEFVSPKIIKVFKEAEKMTKKPDTEKIIKMKIKPPSTAQCLVKSSLLPGWGQVSRGEKKKGNFLIGAFTVSLAALTLSHLAYLSAENSYMNAEIKSDIEYQYSRYNFTYKTRYIMMEVSLFIWLYAVTDIFMTEPQKELE